MTYLAGLLVVLGALLVLVGSLGLLRLPTFYERVHPPTMGTTLGTGLMLLGSMAYFTALDGRPVLHEALIGVFMTLSTPVTYMVLVRAALYRDGAEGRSPEAQPRPKTSDSPSSGIAPR